ncbi:MAG: endonuclease/exonuclease/phosphatase family protein [Deltaproteobacteria bacterium]|nr:endonuclease/exonuclease/phosphatase family protein [Deltaproteobacteria bacterium]
MSTRRISIWLTRLVISAAFATGMIYMVNRHLHGALVSSIGRYRNLRVLTWNIGKLYLPIDSRAADRDLRHVAKVIEETGAHVVALQELKGPTQLGRLLALLGPAWHGRVPQDAYDRRPALITRLPARFIELMTSTGRAAQAAELTMPGGEKLIAASIHLDAFDAERRTRQIEEIINGLNHFRRSDVLLAGDFNFDAIQLERGSPEHRLYLHLSRTMIDAGRHAGGTTLISQRLDYVFYRIGWIERTDAHVLRGRRINIMDHDPLLVELALRASVRPPPQP